MKKQKTQGEATPELKAVSTEGVKSAALVEFVSVNRERWRVARFDLLAAELGVDERELPEFLAVVSARPTRSWMVVRRLFGVQPVLPGANADPEDLRVWGRTELQEKMGLTRAQLQEEFDAARGMWKAEDRRSKMGGEPPLPGPLPHGMAERGKASEELVFEDDEVLRAYGFAEKMFQVLGRDEAEGRAERAVFAKRVMDWLKVLDHPPSRGLGRQALLTELQLRRMEVEMLSLRPGSEDYPRLNKLNLALAEEYRDQLAQIDEKVPWLAVIAGKVAFKGVITELVEGIQKYKEGKGSELIDGIFTATDVQIQMRRSVQAPEPAYRAGLVVFLNAARAGFWDANWRSRFTLPQLRAIDAGWKAAACEEMEAEGPPLVDLEADGPEGEYPELKA